MTPGRLFIGLILFCLTTYCVADDALQIMQKSFDIKRVDTQITTLNFRFINANPDQEDKIATYIMVWKNMHGKGGFDNKAIFFTEQPPEKKGIAYLGWLREKGSDKLDDEWVYLPELRMTRRIVQRQNKKAHDVDEFGNSLLTREHLEPRPPSLDEHSLIGEELFNEQAHYLIKSTAKKSTDSVPDRISWVNKNTFRTNRVQYLQRNKPLLDVQITWVEKQGYWLWKELVATQLKTKEKTQLTFTAIKINTRLKDRLFHKRSLHKGARQFQ